MAATAHDGSADAPVLAYATPAGRRPRWRVTAAARVIAAFGAAVAVAAVVIGLVTVAGSLDPSPGFGGRNQILYDGTWLAVLGATVLYACVRVITRGRGRLPRVVFARRPTPAVGEADPTGPLAKGCP